MPELPEVEVTRLSLAGRVCNARIEAVRLGKPLRWPLGCPPDALIGQRIVALSRRGKYLWFAFEGGDGLLMHLGMSGSLNFTDTPTPPGPWDHFDLCTSHGNLRLTDPRRFGAVVWSTALHSGTAGKLLAGLGVEPLEPEFTAAALHSGLQGRRVAIKQALLAGDLVVGVGNIYASEALFLAGIDPRTPAGRLTLVRCARLVESVRRVLTRALELGGSTLRDFRDAHGASGAFQQEANVYGRAGEPCHHCGTTVQRLVQGQRSTYYCPRCQRR